MPLYDFRCEKCGNVQEYMFKYSELPRAMGCNAIVDGIECPGECVYFPSFYYTAPAQRFDPVVIHKDAQGNIRFPAHANAPIPEGFQKVELTTVSQVRSLEREVNFSNQLDAERFRASRRALTDGQLKENRRVMEKLIQNFTPRGRRFYEAMRQVSEMRQQQGSKPTRPEFFVEAFTNNQSNRDAYYNEHGGSHRR